MAAVSWTTISFSDSIHSMKGSATSDSGHSGLLNVNGVADCLRVWVSVVTLGCMFHLCCEFGRRALLLGDSVSFC